MPRRYGHGPEPADETLANNGVAAPRYVNPVVRGAGESGPKGKSLRQKGEGEEFEDGEGGNASFEAEIGSEQDPGRLAEKRYRKGNEVRRTLAEGTRHEGEGGNPYEPIGEEDV
jgi:hypothetical protein